MDIRFWVGTFTYTKASRSNWVMATQFFAVHDKHFFPHPQGSGEVILYTSEYDALARFPIDRLKSDWHIATVRADRDLCRYLVGHSLQAQLTIRQLSQAYAEYAPVSLPSELQLYEDAFFAEHNASPDGFFFQDELEKPNDDFARHFIPSIQALFLTVLRYENAMEVSRQRALSYISIDELYPSPGFDGNDDVEAQWMIADELAKDRESYERSNEKGWFYDDQ